MSITNIKKVSWIRYLEREQEFFIAASFFAPYGKLLKEVTGFEFKHQLCHYAQTMAVYYRDEREAKAAETFFATLIDANDKMINDWIKKEEEIWNTRSSLRKITKPAEIIQKFQEALLYNTVIPYRLLTSLEFTRNEHSALYTTLERIRSRSLYPTLFKELIAPLLNKAAKKLGIASNRLSMITPEELVLILKDKLKMPEAELQKREDGCYIYQEGNQISFYYGKLPLDEENIVKVTELKGSIAYRGKVKGAVKIINTPSQMKSFQNGNILVSINTNPSLMPIIKIASAIVTDEGGITCHAAIICRELKIPCIIGTKHATKVFKDGDMVEVDAGKGIVKRL